MPTGTALTAVRDVVLGTTLSPPTIPCRWGTWTFPGPPGYTQMSTGTALTAAGDGVLGRMLSPRVGGCVVVRKANTKVIPSAAAISTADAMRTIARRVRSKDVGVLVFMADLSVVGMRRCAATQCNAVPV
jgi:hypothetical protein